jgi:hypothetical protein
MRVNQKRFLLLFFLAGCLLEARRTFPALLRLTKIMPSGRDQMKARGAGGGVTLIPKIPYVPAPSDPRHIPAWYERMHRAMEDWREKTNQAISSSAATVQPPP